MRDQSLLTLKNIHNSIAFVNKQLEIAHDYVRLPAEVLLDRFAFQMLRFESCFLTAHPAFRTFNNSRSCSGSHIAIRAHGAGEGEGLRIVHNTGSVVGGLRSRIAGVGLLSSCSHILRGGPVKEKYQILDIFI